MEWKNTKKSQTSLPSLTAKISLGQKFQHEIGCYQDVLLYSEDPAKK